MKFSASNIIPSSCDGINSQYLMVTLKDSRRFQVSEQSFLRKVVVFSALRHRCPRVCAHIVVTVLCMSVFIYSIGSLEQVSGTVRAG